MRHVAPPLAELTAQAQTLTSAGDLAGARDVLADALDPADADPRRASPDLALAAALQARILIALGDPHAARTWAGFAHAAEERLHGPHDERTIAAAATYAAVLHRVGSHGRAIAFGLMSLIRAWLARREHRLAIVKLNALSDRELKDVGLERDQIQTAVTRGRTSVDQGLISI